MLNDNLQTKICKTCGRELPLEEFPNFFGRVSRNCKCCSLEKRIEKRKQQTLETYEEDDTLKIKRVYKHIKKFQILTKKVSGIAHLSQFEKFVRLLDYKHTWVSNYGRIIIQNDDGTYELLNSLNVSSPRYCFTRLSKEVCVSKISSRLKISLSLSLEISNSDPSVSR